MQKYIFFWYVGKKLYFCTRFQNANHTIGKVLEWLKRPAWKASKR